LTGVFDVGQQSGKWSGYGNADQHSVRFTLMTEHIRCYDIPQDMDIWQSREGIKINIFLHMTLCSVDYWGFPSSSLLFASFQTSQRTLSSALSSPSSVLYVCSSFIFSTARFSFCFAARESLSSM
jgi:hypothetical protein